MFGQSVLTINLPIYIYCTLCKENNNRELMYHRVRSFLFFVSYWLHEVSKH